jgi:predicted ArsR family transcriptional regulator
MYHIAQSGFDGKMTDHGDEGKQAVEAFRRSEKRHLREKVLLLRAIESELGANVRVIVKRERANSVRAQWTEIAESEGKNDIEDLIRILWDGISDFVHYEVVDQHDGYAQLRVHYCLFAEIAKELGVDKDWGYELYCADDPHIVAGFNPHIELKRGKTLMEGHDCCDHCYILKQ